MIYLFIVLAGILSSYTILIYSLNRIEITWKYKALIYGMLTFLLLVSSFLAFSHYDTHWKIHHETSGCAETGSTSG